MSEAPYVELHCHSAFSFLDGASLPEELAAAALAHGYEALALTDHDGVWGAMEFAQACDALGVRPIVGAELSVTDRHNLGDESAVRHIYGGQPHPRRPSGNRCRFSADDEPFHLTLLVESATGWRNLCRLITEAHSGTRPKPEREPLPPLLPLSSLEQRADGLVCLSGCAREGALTRSFERAGGRMAPTDARAAEALGRRLLAAFGPDRFRVELQRPFWRQDRARNRWLASLAERLGVPCVATGNVHAHHRDRAPLQDALVAARLRATLDETEPQRRGNASSVMASPATMVERFREHPDALAETRRLAERLRFDLTRELGYTYPGAEDHEADRTLAEICGARLEHRYAGTPERPEAKRRLAEELRVIRSLGLSDFFLLHFDILELAREVAAEVRGPDSARGLLPPGRGRGSSVSSVVCYLTGLSHVDPVRAGLFLGRFLNEELTEVPDIDLDLPRDIRERLIPRVHERYGPERSALVAAFACYRSRGAVRDLGKALGLPLGEVERVAGMVDVHSRSDEVERDITEAIGPGRAASLRWRTLARLVREAWGLPRHLSQHPGGMVLATRPLVDVCPVQPAAMEGRQVCQWDKDSCADAGFLKIDLLGLGMLSAVERCVDEIARVRGERIDLSRIPLDDPEVFAAIRRADTTGTFQIESRAQMQMLPRTRPESIEDLTVQVALVRPGPIQGGAVHPYLERRQRLREEPGYEVPYEHPCLEPILRDTLGAIVFQDQVIQVAMALAGFSAGEAEGLRRAMSRKRLRPQDFALGPESNFPASPTPYGAERSEAAILAYRDRFIEGALCRGVERAVAERMFEQVRGFSGFGFPKSHAAAFALLAYQSTWLRVHYAPELLCSLLNEQPMGFYPPDALVHEAQRRGIEVRGADVNRSAVDCTVEAHGPRPTATSPAVRIGLGYIKGVREEEMRALVAERERGGPYAGVADLASRSGASRDGLERLAWAGACECSALQGEGVVGKFDPGPSAKPNDSESLGLAAATEPRSRADDNRRRDLWMVGLPREAQRLAPAHEAPIQLSLPLPLPKAPALRGLDSWERILADYGSTGITLEEHPLALLRPELGEGVARSEQLERLPDQAPISVAGIVVARQRPATANGVVFMLLEDEAGTINLVILPPVYERHRLTVRTASLVLARGRLERRDGVINVIASELRELAAPHLPRAQVRQIEPPAERETGRDADGGDFAALAAVAPKAHSFGRRG